MNSIRTKRVIFFTSNFDISNRNKRGYLRFEYDIEFFKGFLTILFSIIFSIFLSFPGAHKLKSFTV